MGNQSKTALNYNGLLKIFKEYEEVNLTQYVQASEDAIILGNSTWNEITDGLRNPYFNLYHYCCLLSTIIIFSPSSTKGYSPYLSFRPHLAPG